MTVSTTTDPPVQQTEDTTTDDDTLSISKTNVEQAQHHYKMAQQSLARAFAYTYGMSLNSGDGGQAVSTALDAHKSATLKIDDAQHMLTGVDEQRRAWHGR